MAGAEVAEAEVAEVARQMREQVPPETMPRSEFRAMGSKVVALLDKDSPAPVIDQVQHWFADWEQTLSRFSLDSELSKLNADAGEARRVSPTVWAVLQTGIEAEVLTDGLVNPLVLEALVLAGYDRPFDLMEAGSYYASDSSGMAESRGTAGPFPLPSPMDIIVDAVERTVRIPAGSGLDFGGVAKGWSAHQAMERLSATAPALVSAGGDVAVSGPRASGEPWRIGVEDPAQRDRYVEMIYLESGGVATSGKDHRHWQRGGVFQHHVIDPRTRLPAQTDILAATVVASNVMRAEALAKAVLIAGSEAGLPLLDAHEDAEAILVLDDGRLMYSRNIGDYL